MTTGMNSSISAMGPCFISAAGYLCGSGDEVRAVRVACLFRSGARLKSRLRRQDSSDSHRGGLTPPHGCTRSPSTSRRLRGRQDNGSRVPSRGSLTHT
eukprot:scaffold137215_cov31-Tisochrysis_lutea.AAC.3